MSYFIPKKWSYDWFVLSLALQHSLFKHLIIQTSHKYWFFILISYQHFLEFYSLLFLHILTFINFISYLYFDIIHFYLYFDIIIWFIHISYLFILFGIYSYFWFYIFIYNYKQDSYLVSVYNLFCPSWTRLVTLFLDWLLQEHLFHILSHFSFS